MNKIKRIKIGYEVKLRNKLYYVDYFPQRDDWEIYRTDGEEVTHEKEGEKIIKLVKEYERKEK